MAAAQFYRVTGDWATPVGGGDFPAQPAIFGTEQELRNPFVMQAGPRFRVLGSPVRLHHSFHNLILSYQFVSVDSVRLSDWPYVGSVTHRVEPGLSEPILRSDRYRFIPILLTSEGSRRGIDTDQLT
jgi:hypothetical protein